MKSETNLNLWLCLTVQQNLFYETKKQICYALVRRNRRQNKYFIRSGTTKTPYCWWWRKSTIRWECSQINNYCNHRKVTIPCQLVHHRQCPTCHHPTPCHQWPPYLWVDQEGTTIIIRPFSEHFLASSTPNKIFIGILVWYALSDLSNVNPSIITFEN